MKSVKVPGGAAVKGAALGLAGVVGVLLVIRLAWWVLEPMHTLVVVYIVAHAVVKLYVKAVDARARVLAKQVEVYRGRRGRR